MKPTVSYTGIKNLKGQLRLLEAITLQETFQENYLVRTEQCRNASAGETGDPRENSLTSCIVRHDSHSRKSGSEAAMGKAAQVFTAGSSHAAPILADQQARPGDVRRGARQTHPRRSEGTLLWFFAYLPRAKVFSAILTLMSNTNGHNEGSPTCHLTSLNEYLGSEVVLANKDTIFTGCLPLNSLSSDFCPQRQKKILYNSLKVPFSPLNTAVLINGCNYSRAHYRLDDDVTVIFLRVYRVGDPSTHGGWCRMSTEERLSSCVKAGRPVVRRENCTSVKSLALSGDGHLMCEAVSPLSLLCLSASNAEECSRQTRASRLDFISHSEILRRRTGRPVNLATTGTLTGTGRPVNLATTGTLTGTGRPVNLATTGTLTGTGRPVNLATTGTLTGTGRPVNLATTGTLTGTGRPVNLATTGTLTDTGRLVNIATTEEKWFYVLPLNQKCYTWLVDSAKITTYACSGFSHVGIVPDDAAGRRVSSGICRFPRPCIPALFHTHLNSPSSVLYAYTRNRVWETGDPLENPLTSAIIPYDSHLRKTKSYPAGNKKPGSPWWQASSLTTTPLRHHS
ncbi:hypothetical protein PR048_024237 [Dryococelus australis]|uniref:Uncharacterized protein n=1 Tax=Dryococelus australis TaxID=614101 RepID=A0ABQ9GN05_9NEOP|nr:hypothetical protein PR048_024237 [Dryococelus australis]